jgi:hypothetical protein
MLANSNTLAVVGDDGVLVVDSGNALSATRKTVDVPSFRTRMVGDDPILGRNFDRFCLAQAIDAAYKEASPRVTALDRTWIDTAREASRSSPYLDACRLLNQQPPSAMLAAWVLEFTFNRPD